MSRRKELEAYSIGSMGSEIYLILAVAGIAFAAYLAANKHPTEAEYRAALQQIETLKQTAPENVRTEAEYNALKAKYDALAADNKCPVEKKPPIITLSDAAGYSFASGSIDIGPAFRTQLRDKIAPQIVKEAEDAGVDTILVIGHTDEAPLGRSGGSSLDLGLIPFVTQQPLNGLPVNNLTSVDNVGLGMGRAAAVARLLRKDMRLDRFNIVPLSGGQVMKPDGSLSLGNPGWNASRRRIELRLIRQRESPRAQPTPHP